jgi:hypothetical protein
LCGTTLRSPDFAQLKTLRSCHQNVIFSISVSNTKAHMRSGNKTAPCGKTPRPPDFVQSKIVGPSQNATFWIRQRPTIHKRHFPLPRKTGFAFGTRKRNDLSLQKYQRNICAIARLPPSLLLPELKRRRRLKQFCYFRASRRQTFDFWHFKCQTEMLGKH